VNWTMLVLLTLAASRAVHLVADDLVPFGYLREWLEKPQNTKASNYYTKSDRLRIWFATGLGCTFCMSIWAGAASAALAINQNWTPALNFWDFMVLWFAIAQAIVLIEITVSRLLGDE
jgi:hypothetical protein